MTAYSLVDSIHGRHYRAAIEEAREEKMENTKKRKAAEEAREEKKKPEAAAQGSP